jgi:hypothetical protein
VHALGQPVPAKQPQAQKRRLQEERRQALHRQRSPEHITDEARILRPVHPELELLHQPRHDPDRHIDQQQRAEEPGHAPVLPEICIGLNLDPAPQRALEQLGAHLDSAYRQTADRLDANLALEIAEMPDRVAFSEVLLEVCSWTGFADAFTHLSEGRARAKDLHISVSCAPCGAYPERMKMVFGRPGRRRL